MGFHQTGFAEVNGAKVYYETAGEGNDKAVVFLHAGVADRRMWDSQFDVFAEKYRVVRYDHRSYGKTEGPEGEYSPVQELAGLLAYLGIEKTALVGCSIGGGAAINFTLTHPEKVWALVLSGPALGGFDYAGSEQEERLETLFSEALEAGDLATAAEADMELWLDGHRPKGSVGGPIREQMRDMLLNAFNKNQDVSFTKLDPPAAQRLAEIQVPTLVVVGDADVPDMLKIGDVLEKGVSGARKTVYPNTAHMLNMEIPAQFNADVLAFLGQAGLS
jgi:3-oxoadipate enol-lactonase